jgi:hypothetical protein
VELDVAQSAVRAELYGRWLEPDHERNLWDSGRHRYQPATNFAVPAPFDLNGCNPDFINVDLTATKKFGKWEFGGVAYGSTYLTRPIVNYQKQSEFAVGGLLRYDIGPVTLQAYVTTEVVEHN